MNMRMLMHRPNGPIKIPSDLARITKPSLGDIMASSQPESTSLKIARSHEANQRFLFAAEIYEKMYNDTNDPKILKHMSDLAEKAIEKGKLFDARAIFIKLSLLSPEMNEQLIYIKKVTSLYAEATGEAIFYT